MGASEGGEGAPWADAAAAGGGGAPYAYGDACGDGGTSYDGAPYGGGGGEYGRYVEGVVGYEDEAAAGLG